jgi:hypothetical protein
LRTLPTVTTKIRAALEAIEHDSALFREKEFNRRANAIDELEFGLIDRMAGLLDATPALEAIPPLLRRAEQLKQQLEAIDTAMFEKLRAEIRAGGDIPTIFRRQLEDYGGADGRNAGQAVAIGYDHLDLFINGLLLAEAVPSESQRRTPEMVFYQPTPARIILDLTEQAQFSTADIFFDIGSGPGQVAVLVYLLTGVPAIGIEFEPMYYHYARNMAAKLNLSRVEFLNLDARAADYATGTVFFLYTPFGGTILQDVLDKLREEARRRTIRLFTFGPCTAQVTRQHWLTPMTHRHPDDDHLAAFISR